MYLKDKNSTPGGGYVFYYENPKTGKQIRIPANRRANGVDQLTRMVAAAFVNNDIPVPKQLATVVEHQICIRQPNPESVCYSGGLGDDIHSKLAKPVLRSIEMFANKVKANAIARTAKRVSGCSGCGGTRVYRRGKNNLGRAGTLNRAAKLLANKKRKV